jgi:hypothetical protein
MHPFVYRLVTFTDLSVLKYHFQPVSSSLTDYVANKQAEMRLSAEEYFQQNVSGRNVPVDADPPLSDRNVPVDADPPLIAHILVITAPRSSPAGYLARVLAELHRQTEVLVTSGHSLQHSLHIVVCNVDHTNSHQEFDSIPHIFHTVQLYQNITNIDQVFENKRQKEKFDFVGCVTRMFSEYLPSSDSDLLLVLEDDALIVEDFFPTLSSILQTHLPSYQQEEWLDIKLYTPPKWSGFGLELLPAIDLVAYSGLIATFYVFITMMISRYDKILKISNSVSITTSGFLLVAAPTQLVSTPDCSSAG